MSRIELQLELQRDAFAWRADINLPLHGVIGVWGASGSGKTTLLRCVAGLERARGRVCVNGETWQDDAQRVFRDVQEREVGFVFQEPRLFPHLNVRRNLDYGWRRTPEPQRRVSWARVIDVLGIDSLLDRPVHGLSVGEQQRVAIARTLLTSPRLLCLDEPLAALDERRKREIIPFITRVAREFSIPMLYVSHTMSELLQSADQMIVVERGHVLAAGEISEVLTRCDMTEHFGESAGSLLIARLVRHEPEFQLTHLDFFGQSLYVPLRDVAANAAVRVQVMARNVSLATQKIAEPLSILNQLRGTVVEIGAIVPGSAHVEVRLDVGAPLLASITRKSLAHLALRPGQQVYAYFKAVALGS